ncbi:MAG TPA: hypothetical protein ENJ89_09155 [Caldithrix abyssi]|uniref:Porin n=1 Tax=Caldithrix abyssi TaxID=187145 RepID=A0A7V5PQG0_CALAY|nr:hypothetical protein [Caldithrix abyssi]
MIGKKGALLIVLFLLLAAGMVQAQQRVSEGGTEWDNGIIKFKSKDGKFALRYDVRAFINGAVFFENKNKGKLSNGTHLRKGRFALKTRLWSVWKMEWDMDIAEGVVEVKDMFLAYEGFENSSIKFGNFKMPFGLEILTSSRYIPFAERAYNALAFKMGRRMALQYARWGEMWNVRAALFGQTFDTKKNKTKDETGGGLAVRVAAAPIQRDDLIVHAGAAYSITNPDDETDIEEFKSEPETKIGDVEILDTDLIRDVDNTTRIGVEGAIAYKNFHVQTEYQMVKLARLQDKPEVNLSGGYIYFLWTLTGESRKWNKEEGEFGQLIPKDTKKGAWELGFRYSYLDLSDTKALVLGGMANNYTAGVNWYANPNMVFQLNYTMVQTSQNATGNGFVGNDNFSYIQFMTKFFF